MIEALIAAGLALLVACVLLPVSPWLSPLPGRDAGIFLEGGNVIRHGGALYLDFWDHKGPVIFWLNAIGLMLGNGSPWGVWVEAVLLVSLAAIVIYAVARRVFGLVPATLGALCFVAPLVSLAESYDSVELFGLPFQALIIYSFYRWYSSDGGQFVWSLAIGVCTGVLFLMRANAVGAAAAVLLCAALLHVLYRGSWRRFVTLGAAAFAGFAVVLCAVAAFFAAHGAWSEFVNAAFRFNFAYSAQSTLHERISSLIAGITRTSVAGASVFAIAGWLAALPSARRLNPSMQAVTGWALVALPIEMLLSSSSGFGFAHYYIPWLPAISILAAFMAYTLVTAGEPNAESRRAGLLSTTALIPGVAIVILGTMAAAAGDRRTAPADPRAGIVSYVTRHTFKGAPVLFWGAESELNFLTGRPSPSRFTDQAPLYVPSAAEHGYIRQFLADVDRRRPSLILDTAVWSAMPPIDATARDLWNTQPHARVGVSRTYSLETRRQMEQVFEFINTRYQKIDELGADKIPVYALRTKSSTPPLDDRTARTRGLGMEP